MSDREVTRIAVLALVAASLLGCSRAPAHSEPTLSASSAGTQVAAAPSAVSASVALPADSTSWRTGSAYRYRVKLTTKLELASDQPAFDFDLTGDLRVIPGPATPDALPLYLTLDNAKILSRVAGTQPALDKVAAEVAKTGAVVTFKSGRVVDLRVVPGLSAIAANVYRELGATLQFSREDVRTTFTVDEYDTTGQYVAEYRQGSAPGHWQKKKLRYSSILGVKAAEAQAPSRPVPQLEASAIAIELLPSGRPASIESTNDVRINGAQAPVRSSTSALLKADGEQALPDSGLDWSTLLTKTQRVAADEPYGAMASVEAMDDARIHGQTFEQLFARVAERELKTGLDAAGAGGADRAALGDDSTDFIALAALFRRKPATVALALAKIRRGARGSDTLIDALGSSSSSEAQHALIGLTTSANGDAKVTARARRALMRVQRPTDEAIAALQGVLEKKPFDQSALYGIGSYSRHLRDQGEQGKAKALGDFLLEKLRAARSEAALLTTLGALTNAGYAEALGPLRSYLTSEREPVRVAAVRAFQSIKDPAVEGLLVSSLTTDKASDVRISAIDAAQVREPSKVLSDGLASAALSDVEPRVRYRAIELMIQWLRRRPELRSTLEAVASKDTEPKVRDRAKSAL
jgi:hypothetical protein